ncbi:MAG: hypothetical protein ACODAQ_06950 [Phycisphaeraceae bacterium]
MRENALTFDTAGAAPTLGICQWFHYQDHAAVRRAVALMRQLGVRHLRTGLSWADYHRPGGPAWYQWQMNQLREFNVLLSVWHTPPSIAEFGACNSPPKRLEDYGDFIDEVIDHYGDRFEALELWNEPNNRYKWDFKRFDPDWSKFGRMVRHAAHRAGARGVTTVLGGMIPVDHRWLHRMDRCGALEAIDVVAIHGFPGMWGDGDICWERKQHWHGWTNKIDYIARHAGGRPIWITETGLATWDLDRAQPAFLDEQVRRLTRAARAPAERVYWYSLIDLDPQREAIEGFHVDENEYHLGLVTADGRRKPAYHRFRKLLAHRQAKAATVADRNEVP